MHQRTEGLMANEPGLAILALFDQLIDRVKQRIPTRTDGKPIGTRVYSQLVLGMPISKMDYSKPWTPIGGASLQQLFPTGHQGAIDAAGQNGNPPVDPALKF